MSSTVCWLLLDDTSSLQPWEWACSVALNEFLFRWLKCLSERAALLLSKCCLTEGLVKMGRISHEAVQLTAKQLLLAQIVEWNNLVYLSSDSLWIWPLQLWCPNRFFSVQYVPPFDEPWMILDFFLIFFCFVCRTPTSTTLETKSRVQPGRVFLTTLTQPRLMPPKPAVRFQIVLKILARRSWTMWARAYQRQGLGWREQPKTLSKIQRSSSMGKVGHCDITHFFRFVSK